MPTNPPTTEPSSPTSDPTNEPTIIPTVDPTEEPTVHPTTSPTAAPSAAPTDSPVELEEGLFSNMDESVQWTLISLCILAVLLIVIGSVFLIVRSRNQTVANKSEAIINSQQESDVQMNVVVMKEEGMRDGVDTGGD